MAAPFDTYRGTVEAWECDSNGHMNVQFYMARYSQASSHLAHAVGLSPATIRERGLGVVALESRLRYRRELFAGDIIAVTSAVTEVGGSTLKSVDTLRNAANGEGAAVAEHVVACFDLGARRIRPWPAEVQTLARELIVAEPPAGVAPLPALVDAAPPAGQPFETHRGAVESWECDYLGHLNSRFYIARVSAAAAFMTDRIGLPREALEAARLGITVLEHHVAFKQELRAGDTVVIRSGFRGLTNRSLRFRHCLSNAATGATAAIIEVVACLLDLERRKAIALPEAVRARVEANLVAAERLA